MALYSGIFLCVGARPNEAGANNKVRAVIENLLLSKKEIGIGEWVYNTFFLDNTESNQYARGDTHHVIWNEMEKVERLMVFPVEAAPGAQVRYPNVQGPSPDSSGDKAYMVAGDVNAEFANFSVLNCPGPGCPASRT